MGKPTEAMIEAYIACALWSSSDTTDEGEDIRCDEHEPTIKARRYLARQLRDFMATADADPTTSGWREYWTDEQFAHDFWLTSAGHGAGFWDRYYGDQPGTAIGAALSKMSEPYETSLYVSRNRVHVA
jgi:hypothetical protein